MTRRDDNPDVPAPLRLGTALAVLGFLVQFGAIIWGAATISSNLTHLQAEVQEIKGLQVQYLHRTEWVTRNLQVDKRLDYLEATRDNRTR